MCFCFNCFFFALIFYSLFQRPSLGWPFCYRVDAAADDEDDAGEDGGALVAIDGVAAAAAASGWRLD